MATRGVTRSVTVEGSGPDLVLLHGGPGLTDYMSLLDAEVAGWRRIRYQQRGHSPSPVCGPFTIEQQLDDLASVLEAGQVERCVVLGHSWGGHLALQAALAWPDRIEGAVLVDPMGPTGDGGAEALGVALDARLTEPARSLAAGLEERMARNGGTDADATEQLGLLWPGYFAAPGQAPPLPPGCRLGLTAYAETMAATLAHLQDGFAERLSRVDIPVELVLGEHSPLPLEAGLETARLLPLAHTSVIPNAGHLPWHEHPGCVREALTRVAELLSHRRQRARPAITPQR
ncbi:alpha/beta hydrolase [Segeticoccus sp.]|uniref:alpha/beta fold hydrolase n=1 Tax=Segeticoccus sp. TaxID=2706531 RepID=UPI002D7F65BB|nr:alpha/beta hydrolase [Segeticoccus sp.]